MSKNIIIGLIIAQILVVFPFVSCGSYRNEVRSAEETILAQAIEDKNVYDNFWKGVTEAAQVPKQYAADFETLLKADTSGKYGEGGSSSVMLWAADRNITLDSETYAQLQRQIEAGRNKFAQAQRTLTAKQETLRKTMNATYAGAVFTDTLGFIQLRAMAGEQKPATDADGDGRFTVLDYRIITSEQTEAAFETGKTEALDVFGAK